MADKINRGGIFLSRRESLTCVILILAHIGLQASRTVMPRVNLAFCPQTEAGLFYSHQGTGRPCRITALQSAGLERVTRR
jgi:hypothetical protein